MKAQAIVIAPIFILLVSFSACSIGPIRVAFDFENSGAVDFIGFLREEVHPDGVFTIKESRVGWVKDSDLPE